MTTRLAAIAFTSDIARLTENFTGRQWVFDDINRWLKESEERFFILTGEPGVGKSAISARLTQIRDDIAAYHFCRAGDVETVRPGRILRSLAAQLGEHLTDYGQALANTIKPIHLRVEVNITIGSMIGSQVTGVYIENLKESDPENELDILIRAPLEELQKMYAERQQAQPSLAIILIDSLDEAVTTTGTTLVKLLTQLSKSTSLPSWVRFVMTSRPERRVLRGFEPLKPYHLQEKSDASLADVRRYVEERVDQSALRDRLQVTQVQPQTLISEITNLSHGNFLYTTLLLNDIEAGRQALDNLAALPKSIDDIYHGFLSRFSEEDWSDRYKPIFGVLTVAQEPISEKQISNFTKIDSEDVRDSIRIARQFFDVELDEQNKETYSIFHQSLRDYLLDEDRNSDFWCNEQKQHQRIIDFCEKISKSWQQLQEIGRYGLQYLAHHLKHAGQKERLYKLLIGSSSWMNAKYAAFSNDEAYVADLELALSDTTNPFAPHEIVRLAQIYTAKQVVYHRASRNNDADLKTLVWLGGGAEAIHLAHRRSSNVQKFSGLLVIHNTLQENGQPPNAVLLREMWESAQAIEILTDQNRALRELAIALGQVGDRPEVNAIFTETVESIQAKAQQVLEAAVDLTAASVTNTKEGRYSFDGLKELAFVLIQLGQFVEAKRVIQILENSCSEDNPWGKGELITLYSQLSIALAQATQFDEAERITRTINDSEIQANTFKHLAINLAQAQQFVQAERIIRNIDSPAIQTEALMHLAVAFVQVGQQAIAIATFTKARKMARLIEGDVERAEAFSELAIALLQADQQFDAMQVFADAKEIALSVRGSERQSEALGKLAIALASAKHFTDAEEVARTIENYWRQAEILRQLGTMLVQAGQKTEALATFRNAREINRVAETNCEQPETLRRMALAFAQTGYLIDAEQIAQVIGSSESRALVLKEIAVILIQTGNQHEAMKFIQIAKVAAYASKSDVALRALVPVAVLLKEFAEAEQYAQAIHFSASRMAALREIVTALAKLKQFTEAERLVKAMETDGHQAIALRELAIARQHSEVEQATPLINSSENPVLAMSQIADAIVQSDCQVEAAKMLDEAEQLARLLDSSKGRIETLEKLKNILVRLAKAGYVLEAKRVACLIKNEKQRSQALSHLATSMALTMNFQGAFNTIGLLDVNTFLSFLSEWATAFEQVEPGLSSKTLKEVVRICGWVHPDWQKLSQLFNAKAL